MQPLCPDWHYGKQPLFETLILIGSLVFIFSSVLRQSKIFLYEGTFFLVIYIFSIGYEYFQNQIGWPLTLLVAGLLSMFTGLMIEKLRKRYFKANQNN